MTDTIETAADQATSTAIDLAITNAPIEKQEAAFNRASIEHRRSAPPEQEGTPGHGGWRDGSDPASLSPMPAAPTIAASAVDSARATLNERSDGHSDLVARWGNDFAENLAYSRAGFAEIVATRPDLIEKFERAGLGDDPSVIEHLAQFGRQKAGMMGDNTIARSHAANNMPTPFTAKTLPAAFAAGPSGKNRGSEETRTELARLMRSYPPGSQGYKDPDVQSRIQQLHRTIAGSGSPVGVGNRRV
jgi:hypothetical protein